MIKKYSKKIKHKKDITIPKYSYNNYDSCDTYEWSISDDEKNLKWFNSIQQNINSDIQQLIDNKLITKSHGVEYNNEFINILCKNNIVLSDNKITLLSQKLQMDEYTIRNILSNYN